MLLPAVFHENLFDDWFDPFFADMDRALDRESRQVFGKRGANMMKTDVKDTGSTYEVAVDLPGCKKEDVKMELENGYLTIQAVRNHNNDQTDSNGGMSAGRASPAPAPAASTSARRSRRRTSTPSLRTAC